MSRQDSASTAAILEKLKSAILNIDWEISDENIGLLNQELTALRSVWQGKRVHLIYLQILAALSQYIATKKENANPGAFPMLRDVFSSLEEMVAIPGDEEEQLARVMVHVDAYNDLKKAVAGRKGVPAAEPEQTAPPEEPPAPAPAPVEQEPEGDSSTINRLLNDQQDHSTDTIFDSMLSEMVPEKSIVEKSKPESLPVGPSPVRPPVQAAYNKNDGTEVEADRNIADEFVEADALLDDFFVDDVPAPGVQAAVSADELDLDVLDNEEDILDLDQAARVEEEPAVADEVESSLEIAEEGVVMNEEPGGGEAAGTEAEPVPELETALADFFGDGEDEMIPHDEVAVVTEPFLADGGDTISAGLDDFFKEEVAEEATASTIVENLKGMLLSVDWEVDDGFLERVGREISLLREKLTENSDALLHLDFLATVIHQAGREQARIITESMACLRMLTESLDGLLSDKGPHGAPYVAQAVSSFIDWHELLVADFEERLVAARGAVSPTEDSDAVEVSREGDGGASGLELLKGEILTEVRDMISREMQALRQELSAKG